MGDEHENELVRAGGGAGPGVLLVGPDADSEGRFHHTLAPLGCRTLTASSSGDAVHSLELHDIGVVFVDEETEALDGRDLLEVIQERWPETVRVLLTALVDVETLMPLVERDTILTYLAKPWNDADLRALTQRILQTGDAARRQPPSSPPPATATNLGKMASSAHISTTSLGRVLVRMGEISKQDSRRAAVRAHTTGVTAYEALLATTALSEERIVTALGEHMNLARFDPRLDEIIPEVVRYLPRAFCEKHLLVPVGTERASLTLAMTDPTDPIFRDDISGQVGVSILPVLATRSDVHEILRRAYSIAPPKAFPEELPPEDLDDVEWVDTAAELGGIPGADEIDIVLEDEEHEVSIEDIISSSEIPPIIKIVNTVISEAIRQGASDIHIEARANATLVRFRIDGMLSNRIRIPRDLHNSIVSRIKVLGKMDIAVRRSPQDGRISIKCGSRLIDLRVSTLPSLNGEKVVCRILDKSMSVRPMDGLGLPDEMLAVLLNIIHRPQGMVIATGPTGSGKTTLLYSMLGEILTPEKNFETIEDPVEYLLDSATQVHVQSKSGFTFASILRATLRQDPDVILIGEIRDRETAEIAFKAALTGHMVLSTLHTNHSIASITRLTDMDIPHYLIASALEGVIAQRLVRRLCEHCRRPAPEGSHELEMLGLEERDVTSSFVAPGCHECRGSGFGGRAGIYEILAMNEEIRHAITQGAGEGELLEIATACGLVTLLRHSSGLIDSGVTSTSEVLRVLGPRKEISVPCQCGCRIERSFRCCPHCGRTQRRSCPDCHKPLKLEWVFCPHCRRPLADVIEREGRCAVLPEPAPDLA